MVIRGKTDNPCVNHRTVAARTQGTEVPESARNLSFAGIVGPGLGRYYLKLIRLISMTFSVALFVTLTATTASASVTYVTQWGSSGTGQGEFGGPVDLAVSPSGTVYVSDTFNSLVTQFPRIQKFTQSGGFISEWGSYGTGNSQFQLPGGVATGPSGDVYVTDFALNRIQRFDSNNDFLGAWGTTGSAAGQFASPWGIAADPQGRVYVVDYGNNRVQKFGPTGKFLDQWGSFGSGDGQFLAPTYIAADRFGNVYVADSGNSRIQKFTSGGIYRDQWATPGPGAGPSQFPLGVATDPKGNVYVVGTNTVQKYTPYGAMLTRWGEYGKGDGQFRNPQGIAADSKGNVYVGDSGNSRVQKFRDPGPPYPDPGTARLEIVRPSSLRVRGGRSGRLVVPVRNTGSNALKQVKVCVPPATNTGRKVRKVACVNLGSIATGKRKVARFAIKTRCRTPGTVRLGLRAAASNASPARSKATILVAECRPRSRPPFPWEGLG